MAAWMKLKVSLLGFSMVRKILDTELRRFSHAVREDYILIFQRSNCSYLLNWISPFLRGLAYCVYL